MKPRINLIQISFFFTCLIFFASCKKEIKPVAGNNIIQYNPFGLKAIYDVLKSSTGEFYYLGIDNLNPMDIVIKTNEQGAILWRKHFAITEGKSGSSLTEKKDGTIVLVGESKSNTAVSNGSEIKFIKFNANGDIVKESVFRAAPRDTFTQKHTDNNYYENKIAPDELGGFYFVTSLEFDAIKNVFISHYSASDSVDLTVNLTTVNTRFNAIPLNALALTTSTNGSLLVSYYNPVNNFMVVEHLDKNKFKLQKPDSIWKRDIEVESQNKVSSIAADDQFVYCAIPLLTQELTYTFGIQIFKFELASGAFITEWTIPLQVFNGMYHSFSIGNFFMDEANLYCEVSIGDFLGPQLDGYVLKSEKTGGNMWQTQVGGTVSRDKILCSRLLRNEIVISGISTNNKSEEPTPFLCKLNKNGKFITK